MSVSKLAIFQVVLVLVCSLGVYQASIQDSISSKNNGNIIVTDSNGIEHHFDETPSRVAITNTSVSYTHLPSPRDLSTSRMPSSA